MTGTDLKTMQAWSLERKIRVSQTRIMEAVERWNGNAVISFSGGKDSTVLMDLARRCYPDIKAVFVDTGLEFPEIVDFVGTFDNVDIIRPRLCGDSCVGDCRDGCFGKIVREVGWNFPSKDVAHAMYYARQGKQWALNYFQGLNSDGTESWFKQRYKKWAFLIDAPFLLSTKCCTLLKQNTNLFDIMTDVDYIWYLDNDICGMFAMSALDCVYVLEKVCGFARVSENVFADTEYALSEIRAHRELYPDFEEQYYSGSKTLQKYKQAKDVTTLSNRKRKSAKNGVFKIPRLEHHGIFSSDRKCSVISLNHCMLRRTSEKQYEKCLIDCYAELAEKHKNEAIIAEIKRIKIRNIDSYIENKAVTDDKVALRAELLEDLAQSTFLNRWKWACGNNLFRS